MQPWTQLDIPDPAQVSARVILRAREASRAEAAREPGCCAGLLSLSLRSNDATAAEGLACALALVAACPQLWRLDLDDTEAIDAVSDALGTALAAAFEDGPLVLGVGDT
tara:strand:+ start:467 stop:793 length:327 start_codon:yes stop_codon:yes gene_type:complete